MSDVEDDANISSALLSRSDQLEAEYPNRPRNAHPTLKFQELVCLFDSLVDLQHKPRGRQGSIQSSSEARRNIITRFIQRWRNDVGPDIYPAFRLIMPDRDKDRPMYGLKEASLGKMLVSIMGIGKDSEDALAMTKWKLPGQGKSVGDFAGRCFEILSKRPFRDDFGNMTIEEVNNLLDRLSAVSKEKDQLPILMQFYRGMNPQELKWLVRIILRQMRVGATERTFFDCWHPDADKLFNVTSSLRKVCWELYDPETRLQDKDTDIKLFQCYQPQLANFSKRDLQQVVNAMGGGETPFWIEEKLDGERIQLHKRGKEFRFFSRKAKEYTYLYGSSLDDQDSSLTRHLKEAFIPECREYVISWQC